MTGAGVVYAGAGVYVGVGEGSESAATTGAAAWAASALVIPDGVTGAVVTTAGGIGTVVGSLGVGSPAAPVADDVPAGVVTEGVFGWGGCPAMV
ncbi:hypothetical protein GCM10008957_23150 [Deinococcus ruber]|uniref:Uncharacterized protein n=1 Tax=Deinococcus ruber TaxID=1848197 RepID=A0A918C6X4_9DEIO|nr:hypothetical protein GCM10008957_23150 [Deinococcus ruber]